jgi:hypothetical protein
MNTQDLEQLSIPSEQALTRRVVEHVRRHRKLPSLAQLRAMTADRAADDCRAASAELRRATNGHGDVDRSSALAQHVAHRRPGH